MARTPLSPAAACQPRPFLLAPATPASYYRLWLPVTFFPGPRSHPCPFRGAPPAVPHPRLLPPSPAVTAVFSRRPAVRWSAVVAVRGAAGRSYGRAWSRRAGRGGWRSGARWSETASRMANGDLGITTICWCQCVANF